MLAVKQKPSRIQERLLFAMPSLYAIKCFLIETVIWKWILSGVFRLRPRPLEETDALFRGQRVLLAACGPGNVSTGPSVDSAAYVAAVDISPEFAKACRRNRPAWRVQIADVTKLPFADGEFDVCAIYSSLHHIPAGGAQVLGELARVTRGRLVFIEGVVPARGALRWMLLLWYKLVDGGCHYYTEEELGAICGQLNLRIERFTRHGPIAHMLFGVLHVSPATGAGDAVEIQRSRASSD